MADLELVKVKDVMGDHFIPGDGALCYFGGKKIVQRTMKNK